MMPLSMVLAISTEEIQALTSKPGEQQGHKARDFAGRWPFSSHLPIVEKES
jgi:hypothetical protein